MTRRRGYVPRNQRVQQDALSIDSLEGTLIALFEKHRLCLAGLKELPHGRQFRTSEGPIINVFTTGTVFLQGRQPELALEFVKDLRAEIAEINQRRWVATGRLGSATMIELKIEAGARNEATYDQFHRHAPKIAAALMRCEGERGLPALCSRVFRVAVAARVQEFAAQYEGPHLFITFAPSRLCSTAARFPKICTADTAWWAPWDLVRSSKGSGIGRPTLVTLASPERLVAKPLRRS